jgi:hypothetical protein
LVEVFKYASRFRDAEITDPASELWFEAFQKCPKVAASSFSELLPPSLLKAFHDLRSHSYPAFPGHRHGKAQKLASPRPVHRAFLRVYRQLEFLLQEPSQRLHQSLPGPSAAYVDVAVVRIPAEPMSPLLQFLVQIIQQDISIFFSGSPSLIGNKGSFPCLHVPPFSRKATYYGFC